VNYELVAGMKEEGAHIHGFAAAGADGAVTATTHQK
jgi:hypothetical protein